MAPFQPKLRSKLTSLCVKARLKLKLTMNARISAHSETLLLRVVLIVSIEVVTTIWKKVKQLRTLQMPGRTLKSKSTDLHSSKTTPSSS